MTQLIVGLGNPGKKYEQTRHNVGFMFIDYMFSQLEKDYSNGSHLSWKESSKFNAYTAEIQQEHDKVILAKPQTFMNNSGSAVKSIVTFFKTSLKDITVVHDDLDIGFGEFKIQDKGPKIHNGIISIEQHLGTSDFTRVRIGVDNREGDRTLSGKDYVLQGFSQLEMNTLQKEVFPQIYSSI